MRRTEPLRSEIRLSVERNLIPVVPFLGGQGYANLLNDNRRRYEGLKTSITVWSAKLEQVRED